MTEFLYQTQYKNKEQLTFSYINTQHAPQISKNLFNKNMRYYAELELFKQHIEINQQGLYHQPYTMNKSAVKLYKTIFYGFAGIFIFLGLLVLGTSFVYTHTIFSFSILLKTCTTLICSLLALASFIIAVTMKTEREAVMQYTRMAKANLTKFYARKRIKLGIKRYLTVFGYPLKEASTLKQMYHEIYDKINECKEETLHLVNRIASASENFEMKETLYNQAIAEFNEKLVSLVNSFNKAAYL